MIRAGIGFRPGAARAFQRGVESQLERRMLVASDRAAREALGELRTSMRAAGLGNLGQALGATSDLKKSGRVFRRGSGFSASGVIFVRSKSERTLGALEAYTEGADILPVRSAWLWIATREIPSRVNRYRMTPARYNAGGFATRTGPLEFVPGRNANEALLIVRNVTVPRSGRKGAALSRKSRVVPSREAKDFIVAFVGIRGTSRAARVDVRAIVGANAARLQQFLNAPASGE